MRKLFFVLGLVSLPVLASAQTPQWAYPIPQPGTPAEQTRAVTQADDAIRARVYPTVPESVPEIIRKGRGGNGVCMGCHLPSGFGQPQSAPIAGLPFSYYVRTMQDFKSGDRKAYRPNMAEFAKAMSDSEIRETALYYAQQRYVPAWIEVRESDTAPRTFVSAREIVARLPGGGDEPLGERVVEVSIAHEKPYLPPGPAYIAYVPRGSLARGAELVNNGGGKTVACGTCHGANLLGTPEVPAIGGRSALHAARQLLEYRDGTRGGTSAAPMKPIVANLTDGDIIAIAAYVASKPAR
jgi:cytochrome c553